MEGAVTEVGRGISIIDTSEEPLWIFGAMHRFVRL